VSAEVPADEPPRGDDPALRHGQTPGDRPQEVEEPLPEHVALNRSYWDGKAADYVAAGERAWALQPGDEDWGIFDVPEAELRMLPDDLAGLDAIELGCGTAYVSAWMARRGARVVGIDNSAAQLATAGRLQREHGLDFPLLLGNAERVPFPDASFDFAISEYGAALWADPYAWVPEAARLLRSGGRLHLLTNSLLAYLTVPDVEADGPADEQLKRPQFGMHRMVWPDEPDSVEFHLAHGEWIRLFTSAGFEILELVEPSVPPDATTRYDWMSADWARRWPCEEIWKVRKRE
jgi:SAM-dependent methyltransferase